MAGSGDPNDPQELQNGLAASEQQPPGDVGQICATCPDNWVEAGAVDDSTGKPLPGVGYRIYDLATGNKVASGILDAEGKSPRHNIPMPVTQLYAIFGTDAAMDEAEGQIKERQREHALQNNSRPDWQGIPAGLDQDGFNQSFDEKAQADGRTPQTTSGFFGNVGQGAQRIWKHVTSDWDVAEQEFYLDERARAYDEYQVATGSREATQGESFGGGVEQGLSFGFGDEAQSRFESIVTGRNYDAIVADRRQIMEAQRLANPGSFMAGEITGAVPTIFVPVGGAAANAARAGRGVSGAVRAGTVTGGATGAVSGTGHDQGGIVDRLDGAAAGALTGGLAGAVLGGAGVLIARGVSKTRIWGRITGRIAPQRKPFHRQDLDQKWYRADNGELKWPPNDGFADAPQNTSLAEGTRVDRYSGLPPDKDGGKYFSPAGSSFESRALPYDASAQKLVTYEVIKPIDVLSGKAAPWFDQAGGGTQYMTSKSTKDLLIEEYIRIVE